MRASLDTNVIIHLYRAELQGILFDLFDEGVFIYEQIRSMELEHHGQDILTKVDSDINAGKIELFTDQKLKDLAVYKMFENNVRENRILYNAGDLGEVYAISLAQTIGAYSLVTDDTKQGGPYMSLLQLDYDGLSVVNGVVFHNDYFVFENKAYLYNILTNIIPVSFGDVMPGFARVISEQREVGNILLRLDDRLALPEEQAISYSTLNFEKYRGPQFHFKDTLLKTSKTISVHFNGKTMDKLLMVVKQKFDEKENKSFWHIELETLPYRNRESKGKYCITTFLHGMYYPDEDIFTHIDYTKNQYDIDT